MRVGKERTKKKKREPARVWRFFSRFVCAFHWWLFSTLFFLHAFFSILFLWLFFFLLSFFIERQCLQQYKEESKTDGLLAAHNCRHDINEPMKGVKWLFWRCAIDSFSSASLFCFATIFFPFAWFLFACARLMLTWNHFITRIIQIELLKWDAINIVYNESQWFVWFVLLNPFFFHVCTRSYLVDLWREREHRMMFTLRLLKTQTMWTGTYWRVKNDIAFLVAIDDFIKCFGYKLQNAFGGFGNLSTNKIYSKWLHWFQPIVYIAMTFYDWCFNWRTSHVVCFDFCNRWSWLRPLTFFRWLSKLRKKGRNWFEGEMQSIERRVLVSPTPKKNWAFPFSHFHFAFFFALWWLKSMREKKIRRKRTTKTIEQSRTDDSMECHRFRVKTKPNEESESIALREVTSSYL